MESVHEGIWLQISHLNVRTPIHRLCQPGLPPVATDSRPAAKIELRGERLHCAPKSASFLLQKHCASGSALLGEPSKTRLTKR